jgi:hypothetical protein
MKSDIGLLELAGALTIAGVITLVLDLLAFRHFGGRVVWAILADSFVTVLLVLLNRRRARSRLD